MAGGKNSLLRGPSFLSRRVGVKGEVDGTPLGGSRSARPQTSTGSSGTTHGTRNSSVPTRDTTGCHQLTYPTPGPVVLVRPVPPLPVQSVTPDTNVSPGPDYIHGSRSLRVPSRVGHIVSAAVTEPIWVRTLVLDKDNVGVLGPVRTSEGTPPLSVRPGLYVSSTTYFPPSSHSPSSSVGHFGFSTVTGPYYSFR